MPIKPTSSETADANLTRLLSSSETSCCTSVDNHRSLILTQLDGATDGFPLTWLYRWQWRSFAANEQLIVTLTEHEVTIHGKHLDGIADLLRNGKGLHLRVKDDRYQSLMRPTEILITEITVLPNSKQEISQN
ncbi:MAG: hypothetical protein ABIO94_12235 [Opitutaceae bacterium]